MPSPLFDQDFFKENRLKGLAKTQRAINLILLQLNFATADTTIDALKEYYRQANSLIQKTLEEEQARATNQKDTLLHTQKITNPTAKLTLLTDMVYTRFYTDAQKNQKNQKNATRATKHENVELTGATLANLLFEVTADDEFRLKKPFNTVKKEGQQRYFAPHESRVNFHIDYPSQGTPDASKADSQSNKAKYSLQEYYNNLVKPSKTIATSHFKFNYSGDPDGNRKIGFSIPAQALCDIATAETKRHEKTALKSRAAFSKTILKLQNNLQKIEHMLALGKTKHNFETGVENQFKQQQPTPKISSLLNKHCFGNAGCLTIESFEKIKATYSTLLSELKSENNETTNALLTVLNDQFPLTKLKEPNDLLTLENALGTLFSETVPSVCGYQYGAAQACKSYELALLRIVLFSEVCLYSVSRGKITTPEGMDFQAIKDSMPEAMQSKLDEYVNSCISEQQNEHRRSRHTNPEKGANTVQMASAYLGQLTEIAAKKALETVSKKLTLSSTQPAAAADGRSSPGAQGMFSDKETEEATAAGKKTPPPRQGGNLPTQP